MTEDESDAGAIRRSMAASRTRLLETIRGVTEEQFKRRPVEGGRCIAELLALQLVSEKLRAERIRMALTEDGIEVAPSDPETQAQVARAGRIAPVPQLIHGLLAARRELERLLDEAAAVEGGLERAIMHPREGRQTVGFLLSRKVAAQEQAFVDEIEALKALVAVQS
ncbi:MAG: DinB family protein [Dehalococcoidia bacterium]